LTLSLDQIRNRKITDILALDVGATSVKAVRLKRAGSALQLLETEVLESVDLGGATPPRLELDKKLHAPYLALSYSGRSAQVRYLDVPGKTPAAGAALEGRLRKLMGVAAEFRVAGSVVRGTPTGTDARMLGVAIPVEDLRRLRGLVPDNRPNLISLEISGLAALHTFEETAKARQSEGVSVYIEAGNQVTVISFFHRGELVLTRKFEAGSRDLIDRVKNLLECDEDAALGILYDDPAPLQESAEAPLSALLKQVAVSRQFVEKAEGAKVQAVHASGGLSYSPYWLSQMSGCLNAEATVWNPFLENGITTYPRGVKGVESMFAPALGAAMAILNLK
jgi:hypothetical protein